MLLEIGSANTGCTKSPPNRESITHCLLIKMIWNSKDFLNNFTDLEVINCKLTSLVLIKFALARMMSGVSGMMWI